MNTENYLFSGYFRSNKPVHNPEKNNWSCPECQKEFTRKDSVQRHLERSHSTDQSVQCNLCSSILKNRFSFDEHVRKQHKQLLSNVSNDDGQNIFK